MIYHVFSAGQAATKQDVFYQNFLEIKEPTAIDDGTVLIPVDIDVVSVEVRKEVERVFLVEKGAAF